MDLRTLPSGLTPSERCTERRSRVEKETGADLSLLAIDEERIGQADEKNCEQMIGAVPLPVGIAGPLAITFSSGEQSKILLPLATTEAALVASVNRGCKVLSESVGVHVQSTYHGMSRSIALKPRNLKGQSYTLAIREKEDEWKKVGEATSHHLKILRYEIDEADGYVFLTIFCDTSEAMGMNMTTIAAQAVGNWLAEHTEAELITVAGNVDSDKKPSVRTHGRGRGYEVTASAVVPSSIIAEVLKTTPKKLLEVADAKLRVGSSIAGALGNNLHAANIIAALYLATGQDAAHVVEGSLADTTVEPDLGLRTSDLGQETVRGPMSEVRSPSIPAGIKITVRLPAVLVGIRGGGTQLPAQSQCLNLLLGNTRATSCKLQATSRLVETIGAAVLAGEISLLAAQATQTLAKAHRELAR